MRNTNEELDSISFQTRDNLELFDGKKHIGRVCSYKESQIVVVTKRETKPSIKKIIQKEN